MSKRPKRTFSREFKLAAVKKHIENGLSAREVAEELEIDDNLIYNWKKIFQNDGSLEKQLESSSSVNAELKRLRDEVRQLRIERDILKKATVFFAREQK
jgi:transposase